MGTWFWISALSLSLGLSSLPVNAQDGAVLFKRYCASCHEAGTNGDSRVPGRDVLGQLTPDQILQTLEKGAMKAQAAERSRAQRRAFPNLHFAAKPVPSVHPAIRWPDPRGTAGVSPSRIRALSRRKPQG
jgi:mono/diheme cytochrome c family protein